MGYTHYLRTGKKLMPEQFDLLCEIAAETVAEWAERFNGAIECLDLYEGNYYKGSGEALAILKVRNWTAKLKARSMAATWKGNREILVIFRDCEPICITPDEDFIFCKTHAEEPADTLAVAIFWLAHMVNNDVKFASDSNSWETAEGRALAERMYRWHNPEGRFDGE